MDIELVIVVLHIVGTILGVGSATMIEVHLGQALKDKLVSTDEKAILAIDYRMIRVGLVLCIMSGFGFLLLDKFEGHTQYLYSPSLWAKIVIILTIAMNTMLLQAHRMNIYWGSALSFSSWWVAACIGIFTSNRFHVNFFGSGFFTEFASLMIVFVVSVLVGAVVLHKFRNKISSSTI